MTTIQQSAILSLGSNSGDRSAIISDCVERIHRSVATVVRVSELYQTPAWGFDGDPFFNCAIVINTSDSPAILLEKLLEVEASLGRLRADGDRYSARTIDIDIIAIGEQIIDIAGLAIPHPRMHERNFVLVPMLEVAPDWHHPILLKPLRELTALVGGEILSVGKISSPLDKIRLDRYNYIAIEGNIGAGKTTLTTRISEDFNAKTVLERFADNPFLPKFYQDQPRYAFPLEMSFLADRYQQISDDLAQFDLFKDFIIADYHIFKSLIFAKVTLTEDEYRLYRKLFEIIYREMPKPDLYIYLYQNTERLLENIRLRGRSYEQEIPAEYLESINKGYLEYIKTQSGLNVLVIDVSDKDFVKNQQDYIFMLEQIGLRPG